MIKWTIKCSACQKFSDFPCALKAAWGNLQLTGCFLEQEVFTVIHRQSTLSHGADTFHLTHSGPYVSPWRVLMAERFTDGIWARISETEDDSQGSCAAAVSGSVVLSEGVNMAPPQLLHTGNSSSSSSTSTLCFLVIVFGPVFYTKEDQQC